MPTIADLLGIVDRFKRDPVWAAQDYARGAVRAVPEGIAGLVDMLPRRPGMGSMTEALNQSLLGSPLESTGTNTEGAGGFLGFPGAGTALKGGSAALGKLGGLFGSGGLGSLLGAGVMTYHGTPHKFDKFDLSKIGTGEGAQVYGHGMYFAENPRVAQVYKDALGSTEIADQTGNVLFRGGKPGPLASAEARAANYLQFAHESQSSDPYNFAASMTRSDNPEMAKAVKEVIGKWANLGAIPKKGGALYKQDLPDEVLPKMLQWDKPLSKQPEAVRKAIEASPYGIRDMAYDVHGVRDPPGEALLRALQATHGVKGAADLFKAHGVPGVSYLDAGSRGAGKGTLNHVVWDQALLDLMRPQRVE